MTAIYELCRLLDERGVEWTFEDGTVSFDDGRHWCHAWAHNADERCVTMGYFTPKEAIEATLGRGECRMVHTRDKPRSKAPTLTCSECGWWTDRINNRVNYCPNCGRKVMV